MSSFLFGRDNFREDKGICVLIVGDFGYFEGRVGVEVSLVGGRDCGINVR